MLVPAGSTRFHGTLRPMTLPNWITAGRIALTSLFLVLAYQHSFGFSVGALVTFFVASVSDYVDGYMARRSGATSRLGEALDPVADKLLVGSALVVLVDLHRFPLWAAVVIAGREIAIQALRTRIVRSGGALPASLPAKMKTSLQMAMGCWWLAPWSVNGGHWMWLGMVLLATVWSGAEYFVTARRVAGMVP
jgi:CDP-diacylglycerol---glycerol-3-phosphate 3-phosphatidyltransferase